MSENNLQIPLDKALRPNNNSSHSVQLNKNN